MKRLSGFSLMEMMVVLLIVSVVAAASAPMINRKMVNAASERSPWVWAGNNGNIAFNLQNAGVTASVGSTQPPEAADTPRLYLDSDDPKTQPQLSFGYNGANVVNVRVGNGSLIIADGYRYAAAVPFRDGNLKIGLGSLIESSNAISIGRRANVSAHNATAVGRDVTARGRFSSVFGRNATASSNYSLAIGCNNVNSAGVNAIAIGSDTSALATDSVAIGKSVNATSTSSTAIGYNSSAFGAYCVALGVGANAGSSSSSSSRSNISSVAIGNEASSIGSSSVAIGNIAQTGSADNSIAIGSAANAMGDNSIAIGFTANASGVSSIAIGGARRYNNTKTLFKTLASGANSIALGTSTEAKHEYSTSIGYDATTTAANQIVLGNKQATVYIPGNLRVDGIVELGVNKKSYVAARINETDDTSTGAKWNVFSRLYFKSGDYSGHHIVTTEGKDDVYTAKLSSDRRLKNVGKAFVGGLEEIKKLELFNYTYKKDPSKTPRVGVMAQDLQKVFPNAVFKGDDGFLRIRMEDMFYALINAVKELDKKIDLLAQKQKKIDELEVRLKELEKQGNPERITKLEKRISELEKSLKK